MDKVKPFERKSQNFGALPLSFLFHFLNRRKEKEKKREERREKREERREIEKRERREREKRERRERREIPAGGIESSLLKNFTSILSVYFYLILLFDSGIQSLLDNLLKEFLRFSFIFYSFLSWFGGEKREEKREKRKERREGGEREKNLGC